MKLHYFKDPQGNFGDDLNPWLWQRLIPDLLDDRAEELFVGIGTLINHRLPAAPLKHIFGSGLGYGKPPPLDNRIVFHAVRGPETARALGLPPEKAITDAAVLVRAVGCPKPTAKTHRFGLILTGQTINDYDWEPVCRELGMRFISCHWDVETVLRAMAECETMLCEAMHGAIVADALRVPWIPVSCNDDILAFKWKDWLTTLSLPYEPTRITSLFDHERELGFGARTKNSVKRGLKDRGLWSQRWTGAPPADSGPTERERALCELRAAATRPPFLSDERRLDTLTTRYLDLLDGLRVTRRARD